MTEKLLKVSPAPHFKFSEKINTLMLDVIIALLPAAGAGIYFYGMDAVKIMATAIICSVGSEFLWNLLLKKKQTIGDLSAVVTGLVLSLILPTYVPLWIPAIGAIFAIIVVKQFFGGLGQNFMNPSAAAKVFLIAAWAGVMAKPVVDTVASASKSAAKVTPTLWEIFVGQAQGNIGETSMLALVIGGVYLLCRRTISLRIPVSFLATTTIMSYVITRKGFFMGDPIDGLLVGAIVLAAIFMATDYASSPMTPVGQIIFGIGCGIFTMVFKVYGYNPDGPFYAIILMNLFAPLIEYFTTPKRKEV
ncbi:RnfABCDGE type electron transport complex subunit D [Clostridium fallax]|uniref:Electron transport complex protein RnfD n=1 Tax=Clostridium fallax TaxID=1533 RepID=A0A1M4YZ88_9CLOT|nr:RnfABCDGE type electron transport complex subunit D [Clostridium fallax]SHF11121.1 electron transport complex protein RnfD [Clostridium fallax]SQB07372.1 RnfABCDGE type electron transport complex subunit D [Clostridium fallax]